MHPEALVFDALTFTLGTGDAEFANSAMDTLEGIRLIKENLPGVLTSLGVSNVSFGLSPAARPVLNSMMLYHAVQAGLDMAIVNPAHITPYAEIPPEERELTEDLIFNRQGDALQRFIEHFEAVQQVGRWAVRLEKVDECRAMTPEERLHWRILYRHKEGVEADIDEIIQKTLTPNPPPRGRGLNRGGWNCSPLPAGEGDRAKLDSGVRENSPSMRSPSTSSTPCCCRQ